MPVDTDGTVARLGGYVSLDFALGQGGNLGFNCYHADGIWRALAAGPAALVSIAQSDGSFSFNVAPAAAAGAPVALAPQVTINAFGAIDADRLTGPDTGAGRLQSFGSGSTISFAWLGGAAHNLQYRIDNGAISELIATQTNAYRFGYTGGSGGPTGVALNGFDHSGNLYGIFVDALSDARIKENVRPTEVDALAALKAIPVEQFDVKAEAAAWLRATSAEPEDRARILAEAAPAHQAIGLVAQKVQAVIADAVSVSTQTDMPEGSPIPPNALRLIDAGFTPYLIRAVQQLAERDEVLTAECEALRARIAALEGRLGGGASAEA